MRERTRTGLEILGAAAILGALGNLLLRQTPWGLNAFLFVAVFTGTMVTLTLRHRRELMTTRSLALQAAMVFFGAMFLIRDSIELRVFDTIATVIIMGVLVLSNFGINQRIAGVFHYAAGTIYAGLASLLGPFLLLGADIDWKSMPGNRLSQSIFAVMRGLAIALPLVLIFGALFMAADAAFENLANRAINFEIDTVISHVVLTSLFAWLTAGYFRGSLVELSLRKAAPVVSPIPKDHEAKSSDASFVEKFAAEPVEASNALPDHATVLEHINRSDPPDAAETEKPAEETPKKRNWQNWDNTRLPHVFTLGTVETIIILGLVDLLFLAFVIVQVPYLFGGMELVQNTPELGLAEYARRGFGELVAVAALVLPILLVSHWLLRRDNHKNERIYRILAGVQIALLFVIMASAVQRLLLLTGEFGYGLTTVRFYPMVLMIWLATVFVWFGMTVLGGRRQYFAWGALWAAIFILGATNMINPDDFIARTNIGLMQQGRDFDSHYNVGELSADAVPSLVSAIPSMELEDRCVVSRRLYVKFADLGDWSGEVRSFNLSRRNARSIIRENDAVIQSSAGCPEDMKY